MGAGQFLGNIERNYWVSEPREYLNFEKDASGSPAKLNVRKLRKLLDVCLNNAQQLLDSAEVLVKNKLYSVSVLLSVLAIEELGKRRIIARYVWAEKNEKDRKRIWRSFRNHKDKIYWAFTPFLLKGDKNDYVSLWSERDQRKELDAKVIDQIKQFSSYTNVVDGEIINPSKFATRKSALNSILIVKQLFEYQNNVEVTDRIIQVYKNYRHKRRNGKLLDFVDRDMIWH